MKRRPSSKCITNRSWHATSIDEDSSTSPHCNAVTAFLPAAQIHKMRPELPEKTSKVYTSKLARNVHAMVAERRGGSRYRLNSAKNATPHKKGAAFMPRDNEEQKRLDQKDGSALALTISVAPIEIDDIVEDETICHSARYFQSRSSDVQLRPTTTSSTGIKRNAPHLPHVSEVSNTARKSFARCTPSDIVLEMGNMSSANTFDSEIQDSKRPPQRPMSTNGTRRFSQALVEERESHRRALDGAWREKKALQEIYKRTKEQLHDSNGQICVLQAELDKLRRQLETAGLMSDCTQHKHSQSCGFVARKNDMQLQEMEERAMLIQQRDTEFIERILFPFLSRPSALKKGRKVTHKLLKTRMPINRHQGASVMNKESSQVIMPPRIRDSDVLRALRRAEQRVTLLEQHLQCIKNETPLDSSRHDRALQEKELQQCIPEQQLFSSHDVMSQYSPFSGDLSVLTKSIQLNTYQDTQFTPFLRPAVLQ